MIWSPMAAKNTISTAAPLLAASFALWGAVQYWDSETAFQSQSRDVYKVAEQRARLAELQAALPSNAILGYVTDIDDTQPVAGAMLFSAQYTLAPRLLQKGVNHDLILGNFTRPEDFAAFGRQRGMRLERDFGNGVVLFKKAGGP